MAISEFLHGFTSRHHFLDCGAQQRGWNVPGGLHGGLQVKHRLNNWAVVLAAGDGSRLQGLTRNERGITIEHLRSVDFSRDVLEGKESMLRVLTVPHCGWTDLGTPERVGAILDRLQDSAIATASPAYFPPLVSLADQYLRMHPTRAHREIRI
jgi:hypothetical protein